MRRWLAVAALAAARPSPERLKALQSLRRETRTFADPAAAGPCVVAAAAAVARLYYERPALLQVGAHLAGSDGTEALAGLDESAFSTRILVEPQSDKAEKLRLATADRPGVVVVERVVGDADGWARFYTARRRADRRTSRRRRARGADRPRRRRRRGVDRPRCRRGRRDARSDASGSRPRRRRDPRTRSRRRDPRMRSRRRDPCVHRSVASTSTAAVRSDLIDTATAAACRGLLKLRL